MLYLIKKLVFTILLNIALISYSYASEVVKGTVIQVKDGDTVVILPEEGGEGFVCRLYGIDAPEKDQPYGSESTRHLKKLVLAQKVEVKTTGKKTYNREICLIKRNGIDVNLEMVKSGYAWAYVKYLERPYISIYEEAEKQARAKKLGLWRQSNPLPPWEWRKRNKRCSKLKTGQ